MALLRRYYPDVTPDTIGAVPIFIRLRARCIEAARAEADFEIAKSAKATPVLSIKS